MAQEIGLFEAMYTCRAMRRLRPEPVPEDLLRRLIDAANQAPSASNAQNARWIVVRDPALRHGIADLNRAAIDRSYGPPERQLEQVQPSEVRRRRAFLWQYHHLQEVPALIVACLWFAEQRPDTFIAGSASAGSVWPGVQNLLLAARGLGLGATPTTLPLSDRVAFKQLLAIPDDIQPFCLVPVGYPMGRFGPTTRRPLSEIMRWDHWS